MGFWSVIKSIRAFCGKYDEELSAVVGGILIVAGLATINPVTVAKGAVMGFGGSIIGIFT